MFSPIIINHPRSAIYIYHLKWSLFSSDGKKFTPAGGFRQTPQRIVKSESQMGPICSQDDQGDSLFLLRKWGSVPGLLSRQVKPEDLTLWD